MLVNVMNLAINNQHNNLLNVWRVDKNKGGQPKIKDIAAN